MPEIMWDIQENKSNNIVWDKPEFESSNVKWDVQEKKEPVKSSMIPFPSMPKDSPAVVPKPLEQTKIYGMLESMPSPMKIEIEKSAIQMQREKKFGVIKKAPSFQLSEMIKNIPDNIEDIVKDTGSLLMNIGRFSGKATAAFFGDFFDPMSGGQRMQEFTKPARQTIETIKEQGIIETGKQIIKPIKEEIQTKGFWNSIEQFIEKRPVDTFLIGQALKSAVGSGIRLTAQSVRSTIPKGVKIGDTLDSFLSTDRAPVIFKMPVEIKPKPQGVVAPESEIIHKTVKVIEFPKEYSKDPFTKYLFQKSFDKVLDAFPSAKQALENHKANKLIDGLRNFYENSNFTERTKLHQEVIKNINTLLKEEQAIVVPYLEGRASIIGESSEQFKNFENWYRNLSEQISHNYAQMGKLTDQTIQERLYQPLEKATGLSREQIINELGDFTPAYVHHMFPETYQTKMGTFFADTTGKRYKPGSLKRSRGVGGYSQNMKEIIPKWTAEYVKFKNTEAFLNDLTTKFGIPANIKTIKNIPGGFQIGNQMYKGYKLIAPDGYLNFYKGKVDFYKEVSQRLANMDFDEAIGEAIKETVQGIEKNYLGVAKNRRVYLVPDNVVKQLESYATPVFGSQKIQNFIKIAYDKPVQLWKDSVLATSPRWIKNNIIGDIIFNSTEGVGPLSYGRAFNSKYKELIPDELIGASFANVMKYNPQLGLASRSTIGHFVDNFYKSTGVRVISKIKDKGYALNTMFEQPFVRSLYIKLARDKAKDLLKASNTPITEENLLSKLTEIKNSKTLSGPLISKVKETLPVFDLTGNFERKYLKRLMPFYNWYKFMIKYSATLPFKHPFKTIGARGLGALSEDQREEAFKQIFPYMTREIEENGIPDRFDNLWPVSKPDKEGKAMFFNSRGFNVFTTIDDMTTGDFLNMMSPIVKVPIERGMGKESFTNREFKTGEQGLNFESREKQLPPFTEHLLRQFPQYELLKQTLVPARQYDTGTIFNPEPILDKITGKYKYPIDSIEKWLNYAGIDKKTLDIRKIWESYQSKKALAIGQTFQKYQSQADKALSFEDIKAIFNELKQDKKKWKAIIEEIRENALQKAKEKKELISEIKK